MTDPLSGCLLPKVNTWSCARNVYFNLVPYLLIEPIAIAREGKFH